MKKIVLILFVLLISFPINTYAFKINSDVNLKLRNDYAVKLNLHASTTSAQERAERRNDIIRRAMSAKTYEEFRELEKQSREFSDAHEFVITIWNLFYISKAAGTDTIEELEKLLPLVPPSGEAYDFIKNKIFELGKKNLDKKESDN
jgi:hypothetical protein